MKWITRERPKIDRIACPWLIQRFIDKEAEFLYVPANQVLKVATETGAIPYDVPDVELSHEGDLCSFDAFLKKYHLTEPALDQLALIVRGADTSTLDLTNQSAGLYAISLGLSANYSNDHEMLKHGMVMYEALYCNANREIHEKWIKDPHSFWKRLESLSCSLYFEANFMRLKPQIRVIYENAFWESSINSHLAQGFGGHYEKTQNFAFK